MRKIFISILFLFSVLCLNANDDNVSKPSETNEQVILKVGTNANYQPFEFVSMGMEVIGFDIDLLKEISKRVGFEYNLIEMGFDNLFDALEKGNVDFVISAISITEERLKTIDFSKPYFNTETLYLKRKIDDSIKSKDDLKGKNVGVQEGTLQEKEAKKINGIILQQYATDTSLINELRAGLIDAIILDNAVGLRILNKHPDLDKFFKEPDGTNGVGIAFKKGNQSELLTKINLAIDEIVSDGTYDNLLIKYNLK